MKFGELIRKRREEKEITLRAFSKAVGLAAAYVSMMERGMNTPPGPEKIKRMAKVLELDPDELMGAAKKVDPDVASILQSDPGFPEVLRTAREGNVSSEDLQKALDKLLAERKRKSR